MMNVLKVGVLGLGTVGVGMVNVLQRNAHELNRRCGYSIEVRHVAVRDLNQVRSCDCSQFRLTDDPWSVVNDPELDVIVELIGGEHLAKELILAAISNGKDIVTANKALIALHSDEIFSAAHKQGVSIFYEAAVAGGIGIIKAVREGMVANRIEMIAGIINGTSNYILSEMLDKGISFNDALLQAQNLGYAEADPSFDIEGIDAAYKLAILSSIAFGTPIEFEKVVTEGITKLNLDDIIYAQEIGYRIKHLAIAKLDDGELELRVHPALVPEKQHMASVDGVMNAVLLKGDAVGVSFFSGAGAGAEATASAVIADLVDVIRTKSTDAAYKVPALAFQSKSIKTIVTKPIEQLISGYYLRVNTKTGSELIVELETLFADLNIGLETIQQKVLIKQNDFSPITLITKKTSEAKIDNAITMIESLSKTEGKVVHIRVEHIT